MQDFPLIYAHRGIWESVVEQNSLTALESARDQGFGVETDFRSANKELAISHDPMYWTDPLLVSALRIDDVAVALNIKEDGLAGQLGEFLSSHPNPHSFIFDGSIPEMKKIRDVGLPHALRLSEYENEIPWKTDFLWIDGFNSDWWIDSPMIDKLAKTHFLVFVSPELHGRPHQSAWKYFQSLSSRGFKNFGVCTDFPENLKEVFCE
jgi:hypothetical protein